VIRVVCVQKRENCARIPENTPPYVHASRIACFSRAPGGRPPLRPAPIRRKMGWLSVKGWISAVALLRAAFRVPVSRTRRRPPRLTLGRSPCWSRRQSVERETPNARIASSIVSRFVGIALIVSQESHRLTRLTLAAPAGGRKIRVFVRRACGFGTCISERDRFRSCTQLAHFCARERHVRTGTQRQFAAQDCASATVGL
jgi:hypothetical protein